MRKKFVLLVRNFQMDSHYCIVRSTLARSMQNEVFFAHLKRISLLRKTHQCECCLML